mmetsp:Transcript_17092/g.32441  ORF Transcript_17092/g.32441 Transcript_17092/m.32441 type:complete len:703 (+) Transcript_17092:192-2300(+)
MNEEKRRLLPSNINPKDRECDFYQNPTILSRLIQNFKYRAAVQRLERHGPAEASVWVCSRRAEDSKKNNDATATTTPAKSLASSIRSHARQAYGYRMLPVHMAVDSLFHVADESLRADLESLISHLVIAFPEGCSRRDHEGKLPLHEAIWHDASPETVSALLMAYPAAGRERDTRGRYPIEINEHRMGNYKEAVSNLLRRKDDFWVAAGQEAHYRLKHRRVPKADQSVASTSVLAGSVKEDDDTLISSDSFAHAADPCHPKAADEHTGRVKAMRWEQIEKRAMTLESKLAESYEQNFKLKQEVTELKVSKKLLQKKVDKLVADDQGQQIAELVTEREHLVLQIQALRSRLAENGLPVDHNLDEDDHPETLEFPTDEEQWRQAQVDRLTKELQANKAEFVKYQQDMQTKVWVLESEIERVRARKDEQIMDLEQKVEELKAADKTVSDFSRSDETISTAGSGPRTPSGRPPRPDEDSEKEEDDDDEEEEVDDVLRTAIHMNGGLGLSPRLVEMWNKVNGHPPTLHRISENARYDPSDFRGQMENVEKVESQEDVEDDDVNFTTLYREAAKKYHLKEESHLLVPRLDNHRDRGVSHDEMRIPPPAPSTSRGISKDLSDVTMSTPSTTMMMWNASSYSTNSVAVASSGSSTGRNSSGGPRNMTKEISEMTMSMMTGAPSPAEWKPPGEEELNSHLPEVSELTMNFR